MRVPILDTKRQYEAIGKEVEEKVVEVLRSGSYILGQNNKALEEDFAKYCDCKHAVALNSGTDALHLALRALDIGAGDEVITVAFTFVATTEAIGIVGATPVFVDIDPDTFNIDVDKIENLITPKTKAILPVHLYGQPCDMDKIMDIAKRHNLYVIEDCCQAVGATYKGKKVGSFGDVGCYSFYPTKNLGTMGDGGMAVTNSEYLKNRMIALRNHGGAIRYYHDEIGVNSRLDEIMKVPAGMAIFGQFMGSLMGGGADKAAGEGMAVGPDMLKMLGSFTILRLIGMMPKQEGAPAITKEQLLAINAELNKIAKAE